MIGIIHPTPFFPPPIFIANPLPLTFLTDLSLDWDPSHDLQTAVPFKGLKFSLSSAPWLLWYNLPPHRPGFVPFSSPPTEYRLWRPHSGTRCVSTLIVHNLVTRRVAVAQGQGSPFTPLPREKRASFSCPFAEQEERATGLRLNAADALPQVRACTRPIL